MRKIIYSVVALIAAVLIALEMDTLFPASHGKVSSKEYQLSKTMSIIDAVLTAMHGYSDTYGHPLQLSNYDNTEQYDRALAVVLCGATNDPLAASLNPQGVQFLNDGHLISNPGLIDAWGKPIHVVITTNPADYKLIVNHPKSVRDGVYVWSGGPNGIDERGSGDDITSWSNSIVK